MEDYAKAIHIEALTALEMAKQEILPACLAYQTDLAKSLKDKKELGVASPNELKLFSTINEKTEELIGAIESMQSAVDAAPEDVEELEIAAYCKDKILPAMAAVRKPADELELLVGKKYWPFPTYTDLLYSVLD